MTYSRNGEVTDFGTKLRVDPHRLLTFTWTSVADETPREQLSQVTFELKPMESTVKLKLTHENLMPVDWVDANDTFGGLNNGWPAILSNLKSLLETDKTLSAISI